MGLGLRRAKTGSPTGRQQGPGRIGGFSQNAIWVAFESSLALWGGWALLPNELQAAKHVPILQTWEPLV